MTIEFRCHQCLGSLTATRDRVGRRLNCPTCGTVLRVPPTAPEARQRSGGTTWLVITAASTLVLAVGVAGVVAALSHRAPNNLPAASCALATPSRAAPAEEEETVSSFVPSIPQHAATPQTGLYSVAADRKSAIDATPPHDAASEKARVTQQAAHRPIVRAELKRLDRLDEQELRRQLLRVREVGLEQIPNTAAHALDFARQLSIHEVAVSDPLVLFSQRSDLRRLPFLLGPEARLSRGAAGELRDLSRELRLFLAAGVPLGARDGHIEAKRLREALSRAEPGQVSKWLRPAAVPTLLQILQAEDHEVRAILVELLTRIPGSRPAQALAMRALTDLSPDVRQAALQALRTRPATDYEPLFLAGLRYPWAPVAQHAAEALVNLQRQDVVPVLVRDLCAPDPRYSSPPNGKRPGTVVQELVRLRHIENCLLCHAPSFATTDPVHVALDTVTGFGPPVYYVETSSMKLAAGVRADTTFLRQDFSVKQPVVKPPRETVQERFDYLLWNRPATAQEREEFKREARQPADYPQRRAVLFALRELTGKDYGSSEANWRQGLHLASNVFTKAGNNTPPERDWRQFVQQLRRGPVAISRTDLGGKPGD